MTTFFIAYNPYTKEYVFRRNGTGLNENNKIVAKCKGLRLQALLSPSGSNWKGLADEIWKCCNDSNIKVVFQGRKMDFDDLEYCLGGSDAANFTLELKEVGNDSDIIKQLDILFREAKESGIEEFEHKNEDGESIFDVYDRVKENIFNINVIATMSSGKSTLINSLLHTELLPAENKACTAAIARILDHDDLTEYRAICYGKDDKPVREEKVVTSKDLKEYNESDDVMCIDIEGDIPAVSSDKIRLQLCDTPGPNNSRDEHHGEVTRGIIREKNAMILYVMNATNLAVNDDKELLEAISAEMKKNGKESRDRFIFVLNKCDMLDEGKGETVEKILDEVREYLKNEFNIIDPVIVPTSARLALLIWKARNRDELTSKEKRDWGLMEDFVNTDDLHYEIYATLTPSVRQKLEKKIEEYHKSSETWDLEAVIHSGVGALEALIEEYIEKYAYPIKISDAIQDIMKISRSINMMASFHRKIESDKNKRDEVSRQIESAQKQKEDSREIFDKYLRKLDSFQINISKKNEDMSEIVQKLMNLTKEYSHKEEVDESEAERLIERIIENLREIERKCRNDLNHYFEKEVYYAGEEMLDEYKNAIELILDNIEVTGYEFKTDMAVNEIKIDNLDDIKLKNKSDRYRDVKKWKKNPRKKGFFGFLKFWEPNEIPYIEKVKDGVNINVRNIAVNVISGFKLQLINNIETMYTAAEEELKEYKNLFCDNLDMLYQRIGQILDQLKEDSEDLDKLRRIVEEEKKKAEFAEKTLNEIEKIIQL